MQAELTVRPWGPTTNTGRRQLGDGGIGTRRVRKLITPLWKAGRARARRWHTCCQRFAAAAGGDFHGDEIGCRKQLFHALSSSGLT